MKTTLFTLLIAIASLGQAQINFEASYPANAAYFNVGILRLSTAGFKYSIYQANPPAYKLYNLNHSLWKTVLLPTQAGYTTQPYGVSDNLFNSDAELEIACVFYKYNFATNPPTFNCLAKVVNESGSTLITIPDCVSMYFVNLGADGAKMLATIDSTGKTSTKQVSVYSLPGSIASLPAPSVGSEINLSEAMPNPSQNRTTIAYVLPQGVSSSEIVIYNVAGQELKRYTVDAAFNTLELDNTDLPSGTYLYQLSAQPGAKKMIVVK